MPDRESPLSVMLTQGSAENERAHEAPFRSRIRGSEVTRLGKRLYGVRKTGLRPRRGILVDDLLVGDAVNHCLGCLERRGSRGLVAGGNRLSDLLDGGAQRRFEAGVVLAADLGLPGTLSRLSAVGHESKSLFWNRGKRLVIIANFPGPGKAGCARARISATRPCHKGSGGCPWPLSPCIDPSLISTRRAGPRPA